MTILYVTAAKRALLKTLLSLEHIHTTPVFERDSPFMFEKANFFNRRDISC